MKRVVIYAVNDFISLPLGGEVTLVNSFLSAERKCDIQYYLVGLSFDKKEIVGKWVRKQIGNNFYYFLPVTSVKTSKERTHIPLRLKVTIGICRYFKTIMQINPDFHYVHSPELAIPLWFQKDLHLIYHVHGDPCQTLRISRFGLFRFSLFTKIYKKIIRTTMKRSEKIIWAADRSKELYLKQQPFMNRIIDCKSITIHSCFDSSLTIDNEFYVSLKNVLKRNFHAVYVGRLTKVKQIDFLIKVIYKLVTNANNIDLLICGDGEEEHHLKKLVTEYKLNDHVFFLGAVSHEKLASILDLSDVFLFASKNEAMSLVILESLYMGVPVVTTNVGDLNFVVLNDRTGYIVEHLDIQEFVDRILLVESRGKKYYSDNCKAIAARFTPDIMAHKIDNVFAYNINC